MAKATTPDEGPIVRVVLESFAAEIDGVPTFYRKGEAIHPDDPAIKRWPKAFGPFEFPHPVKVRRALSLTAPEVRAE